MKFFAGWVNDCTSDEAKITLGESGGCEVGDQFLAELYGETSVASFLSVASSATQSLVRLTVIPPIRYRPNQEAARYCVQGISGIVTSAGAEIPCTVRDISKGGLGMVIRKQLPNKQSVLLRLSTPCGEFNGEGEVRYCRLDPTAPGAYRVGILLANLDRLEGARWQRLVSAFGNNELQLAV